MHWNISRARWYQLRCTMRLCAVSSHLFVLPNSLIFLYRQTGTRDGRAKRLHSTKEWICHVLPGFHPAPYERLRSTWHVLACTHELYQVSYSFCPSLTELELNSPQQQQHVRILSTQEHRLPLPLTVQNCCCHRHFCDDRPMHVHAPLPHFPRAVGR